MWHPWHTHTVLEDLVVVLCTAAVTTVIFRRLRQPVLLGYLLAGLLVGPHVSLLPVVADSGRVATISELGVILVMFGIGLEFSLRRLGAVLPTAGVAGAIQIGLMLWLGFLVGQALGWPTMDSVFLGAAVCISSTMVVARVFDEEGIRGQRTELVFGILIVEDLAAVLLLAVLTALASGTTQTGALVAGTVARLLAFLVGLVVLGFLVVPRAIRGVAALRNAETLLVASVGLCFALSLLAHAFGYSVALGAFLAGSLVAESRREREVEQLVRPLRDLFAAVFFVAVGMSVDPHLIWTHAPAVLVITAVVVAGQLGSVSVGSFLSGHDVRTSVWTGLSLAQLGEFSFIIAGLGAATGATGPALLPIVVAVAVLTTFLTPILIRRADRLAAEVDRRLPHRVQTFATLYGTWLEARRGALAAARGTSRGRTRRLLLLLGVDAVLLGGIVIATSLARLRLVGLLETRLGVAPALSQWLLLLAALAASVPFVFGILRAARRLGAELAQDSLPAASPGRADFADAPRRALVVTIQLGIVMVVMLPLLAVTQPFLPLLSGAPILVLLFALLGVSFWRRADQLQEHVRAGAQVVVDALVRHGAQPEASIEQVQSMLPGMGTLAEIEIGPALEAAGRTLGEIGLRGRTGATAIAVVRAGERLVAPGGRTRLQPGDVVCIAGTHDAVEAARELLARPRAS